MTRPNALLSPVLATVAAIAVTVLGLTAAPAQNQASTSFAVNATAPVVCSVTSADLNFGDYTGSQLDAVATTSVTCNSQSTTWELGYDAGRHSPTLNCFSRRMESTVSPGTNFLTYNIYSDASRLNTLGVRGEAGCVTHTGTGTANRNVFGRIPAGQPTIIGNYQDIVTVTIYW